MTYGTTQGYSESPFSVYTFLPFSVSPSPSPPDLKDGLPDPRAVFHNSYRRAGLSGHLAGLRTLARLTSQAL